MHPLDIKSVLDSMTILVDNREQPTDRAKRRYNNFGVPWERCTLNYGDYTYNATLPDGSLIFDISETVSPLCAVERKMNLDELARCFCEKRDLESKQLGVRNRFEREFLRAQEHSGKIILLSENSTWEGIMLHKYRSRYNEKAFMTSICAFMARYDMGLIMCKEETSGQLIKEILYRDLKNRLERGDFDPHEEMEPDSY